jgi:hypothetical protein
MEIAVIEGFRLLYLVPTAPYEDSDEEFSKDSLKCFDVSNDTSVSQELESIPPHKKHHPLKHSSPSCSSPHDDVFEKHPKPLKLRKIKTLSSGAADSDDCTSLHFPPFPQEGYIPPLDEYMCFMRCKLLRRQAASLLDSSICPYYREEEELYDKSLLVNILKRHNTLFAHTSLQDIEIDWSDQHMPANNQFYTRTDLKKTDLLSLLQSTEKNSLIPPGDNEWYEFSAPISEMERPPEMAQLISMLLQRITYPNHIFIVKTQHFSLGSGSLDDFWFCEHLSLLQEFIKTIPSLRSPQSTSTSSSSSAIPRKIHVSKDLSSLLTSSSSTFFMITRIAKKISTDHTQSSTNSHPMPQQSASSSSSSSFDQTSSNSDKNTTLLPAEDVEMKPQVSCPSPLALPPPLLSSVSTPTPNKEYEDLCDLWNRTFPSSLPLSSTSSDSNLSTSSVPFVIPSYQFSPNPPLPQMPSLPHADTSYPPLLIPPTAGKFT